MCGIEIFSSGIFRSGSICTSRMALFTHVCRFRSIHVRKHFVERKTQKL
jgi:hypothetical protein